MIRVVFMGSADLSATMLERLTRERDTVQVVGCVTQPDKPAGRSKKLRPCACKAFVDAVGIPCLTPERVNTPESLAQIAAWLPDVIVVVAYGQFLSRRLLDIPTLGCINIHLSLLPRYRGASPIHAALLHGDKVTGATAMLMDEGMDSGPILDEVETPIYEDDTLESLHDRLADLGGDLLARILPQWAYFKVRATPQDPAQVSMAYKIRKTDGLLHWTDPTALSLRKLRAYTPWPSCFTYMPQGAREAGKMLRLTHALHRPRTVDNGRIREEHAAELEETDAFEEVRVAFAQADVFFLKQPPGKASHLPLGAYVGTGTDYDVHSVFLRQAAEFGHVVVAGEVELSGLLLVDIPEYVEADGVHAQRFAHLDAVLPVGTGNAGVVEFGGFHDEGFAIEQEGLVAYAEGLGLFFFCRKCVGCGRSRQQCGEQQAQ